MKLLFITDSKFPDEQDVHVRKKTQNVGILISGVACGFAQRDGSKKLFLFIDETGVLVPMCDVHAANYS